MPAMRNALPLTERLRSGRRWIDVQDPAEASALAAGYAALLRAYPFAAEGTGRGGMAPLDELETAVRRVAETWSRSQPAAAVQTAAASDELTSSSGLPAEAAGLPSRGRPRRRDKSKVSALPQDRPTSTASLQALLPLPPVLPSQPLLSAGWMKIDRRSQDATAGNSAASRQRAGTRMRNPAGPDSEAAGAVEGGEGDVDLNSASDGESSCAFLRAPDDRAGAGCEGANGGERPEAGGGGPRPADDAGDCDSTDGGLWDVGSPGWRDSE